MEVGSLIKYDGKFVLTTRYGKDSPTALSFDLNREKRNPEGIIKAARMYEICHLNPQFYTALRKNVPESRIGMGPFFVKQTSHPQVVTCLEFYVDDDDIEMNFIPENLSMSYSGSIYGLLPKEARDWHPDFRILMEKRLAFNEKYMHLTQELKSRVRPSQRNLMKSYFERLSNSCKIDELRVDIHHTLHAVNGENRDEKRRNALTVMRTKIREMQRSLYKANSRPYRIALNNFIMGERKKVEHLEKLLRDGNEESHRQEHLREIAKRDMEEARLMQDLSKEIPNDDDFLKRVIETGDPQIYVELEILRRKLLIKT